MTGQEENAKTHRRVLLTRIRPALNERRFYAMSTGRDLFGNIILFRNWGRIGTGGRVRYDQFSTEEEATASLEDISETKLRRGYGRYRRP